MKKFLLILSLCISALSANAQQISNHNINLTTIPALTTSPTQSGLYNSVILKLSLPEGWYTYYKNGGDTGLGAKLSFDKLPDGAKVTDLIYPTPKKITEHGITSYIYPNEAFFAFNIYQENKEKNPIKFGYNIYNGTLDFLVCKDVCIPMKKEFRFNTIHNYSIAKNFAFLPLMKAVNFLDKSTPTNFTIKKDYLYIALDNKSEVENALFIPDEDILINDGAEQSVITADGKQYLKVQLDEFIEENPTKISGIIIANNESKHITATYKDINIFSFIQKVGNFALIALFALIGGLILNLMPCVLPVIGLKAYAMMKHQNKTERLKATISYCAGVFSSMMVIVAILLVLKALGNNLAWGFQLQNHYFVGFMISLLVLIALNLLGLIKFGDKISNVATKLNMKHSSDFFTGVLTTFVATPCTAPFMATSLGFALATDSFIATFVIFAFLALGICLPIILIAISDKAYKLLPKPGAWSDKLKQALAFPILATAVWLVWVLLGTGLYTDIAISIFSIVFAIWLVKTFSSKIKYVFVLLVIALTALFVLKEDKVYNSLKFNKETIIQENLKGKTVFVDFTAKWCLTCQYNKSAVVETTDIQDLFALNNISYMVADWTNKDDVITQELKALGRSGVPVYAFYKPDDSVEVLNEVLTKDYLVKKIEELNNQQTKELTNGN